MGVVVVTHDLGLAWNIADRIAVMYLGRVVECGTTEEVLDRARSTPTPRRCCPSCPRSSSSSRSCSPARSPTRAGSRPAAGSTRAARRWPTAPPSGPASPRPAGPQPLDGAAGDRRATGSPATSMPCAGPAASSRQARQRRRPRPIVTTMHLLLTRESVRTTRSGGRVTDGELQAALPREMYVDAGQWARRARRRAVRRVVLRRPRRRPRAGHPEAGASRSTWRASRCCVTSDEDGALHAAYNVCRHRGSQLCPPGQPARDAGVAALPLPLVDLRPRRLAAAAPHATVDDPAAFALHPVGVETLAGVRLRPPHARPSAAPLAEQVGARRTRRCATTASATW